MPYCTNPLHDRHSAGGRFFPAPGPGMPAAFCPACDAGVVAANAAALARVDVRACVVCGSRLVHGQNRSRKRTCSATCRSQLARAMKRENARGRIIEAGGG